MNPKVIIKDFEPKFYSSRKKRKDEMYFGINSTFSILISFITLLFIFYIWILNTNATQGYNIRSLELEKQNLLLQKELLDVKISNLESLKSIEGNSQIDSIMEKNIDPDYVLIKSGINYAYNN